MPVGFHGYHDLASGFLHDDRKNRHFSRFHFLHPIPQFRNLGNSRHLTRRPMRHHRGNRILRHVVDDARDGVKRQNGFRRLIFATNQQVPRESLSRQNIAPIAERKEDVFLDGGEEESESGCEKMGIPTEE